MRRPGPCVYTRAEAAAVAVQDFEEFRNKLRAQASTVDGNDPIRVVLVDVLELFQDLEEKLLARFGQPSRMGPDRPELVPEQPLMRSPVNRSAADILGRLDPCADGPYGGAS